MFEKFTKRAKQSFQNGDYNEAEKYYTLIMEICETGAERDPDNWEQELPISYINLGAVHRTKGENEKAEFYYKKALKTTEDLMRKQSEKYSVIGLINTLYEFAGFYMATKQIDKVKAVYREIANKFDEITSSFLLKSDQQKIWKYII